MTLTTSAALEIGIFSFGYHDVSEDYVSENLLIPDVIASDSPLFL